MAIHLMLGLMVYICFLKVGISFRRDYLLIQLVNISTHHDLLITQSDWCYSSRGMLELRNCRHRGVISFAYDILADRIKAVVNMICFDDWFVAELHIPDSPVHPLSV